MCLMFEDFNSEVRSINEKNVMEYRFLEVGLFITFLYEQIKILGAAALLLGPI